MKNVICQAKPERHKLIFLSFCAVCTSLPELNGRLNCGIHKKTVISDKIPQHPRAPAHPNPDEEARGMLIPEPIAPHKFMETA